MKIASSLLLNLPPLKKAFVRKEYTKLARIAIVAPVSIETIFHSNILLHPQ